MWPGVSVSQQHISKRRLQVPPLREIANAAPMFKQTKAEKGSVFESPWHGALQVHFDLRAKKRLCLALIVLGEVCAVV